MFSIDHMIVTCVTTVILMKAMWIKALKGVFISTFFWREENSKGEGSALMETQHVEAPPWQLVGIPCVHVWGSDGSSHSHT